MNTDSIKEMQKTVADFCAAHGWDEWHTLKNAAIVIACEAGELLQIFRFAERDQQKELLRTPESRRMIEDELADVFCGVLDFSNRTGINIGEALQRKLQKNLERYPIKNESV